MSSIAPDIPELPHLPEAARPLVYMHALMYAIRSPATLLSAFIALVVLAGAGLALGSAYGVAGGILGAALGIAAAAHFFCKVLLPWRARLAIPRVQESDAAAVARIGQAAGDLSRMIDAYKRREAEPPRPRNADWGRSNG
jgi:hypothetical protein